LSEAFEALDERLERLYEELGVGAAPQVLELAR